MESTLVALPNEATLLARTIENPAAFATIYDHYFPRVYNYIRYRVADGQLADDLVSLVFTRALDRLPSYDPLRGSFAVWLLAIARNAVNDWLRAQKRRRWLSLETLRDWPDADSAPEETVLRHERRHDLLRAIAELDDRQRDILALKFAAGLTNRRIAELTGLSESNVGVILYRTVRKLREKLDGRADHGQAG
ncbi:MAG: sigma-70 family RNA polymerase sigma factor [Chloroflexi bacterium]|nr:sigma-70 family RNA polymerase sigma factor [Chloroflexota bacterium]